MVSNQELQPLVSGAPPASMANRVRGAAVPGSGFATALLLLRHLPVVLSQTVPEFFDAEEAAEYCRLTARGTAKPEVRAFSCE